MGENGIFEDMITRQEHFKNFNRLLDLDNYSNEDIVDLLSLYMQFHELASIDRTLDQFKHSVLELENLLIDCCALERAGLR